MKSRKWQDEERNAMSQWETTNQGQNGTQMKKGGGGGREKESSGEEEKKVYWKALVDG